jgi:hypothetical protein
VFGPTGIDRMNPDGSGFENIFSDSSQFILQADIDHVNGARIYLDFQSTNYKLLDFDGTNQGAGGDLSAASVLSGDGGRWRSRKNLLLPLPHSTRTTEARVRALTEFRWVRCHGNVRPVQ